MGSFVKENVIAMKLHTIKFLRNVELSPSEVLLVQSDVNYSRIWLKSGRKILIAKTLKKMSELLKDAGFVRVNKQVILNMEHIVEYTPDFPHPEAELSNGFRVEFSRRRALLAHRQISRFEAHSH